MANYGAKLMNDSGKVIADTTTQNFFLRSSGVIKNSQFSSGTSTSPFSDLVLDTSGMNYPLVFFKPMNAVSRISSTFGYDGPSFNPSQKVDNRVKVSKWWNLTALDIQYYIFDRWSPPLQSGYGMRLSDKSGKVIFDSNWYHMIVKKVIWLDTGFPNHKGEAITVGDLGSGNIAIAAPYSRFFAYNDFCMSECFHLSGANNTVQISLVPVGQYLDGAGNMDGSYLQKSKTMIMAVDVSRLPTNYNPVSVGSF